MRETAEQIRNICDAGLYLIEIPPKNGKPSKAPSGGWNKAKSDCNPNGYSNNPDDYMGCEGINIGLFHAPSKTVAFDLDNMELTRQLFENTTDIQLSDWLESDLRFEIKVQRLIEESCYLNFRLVLRVVLNNINIMGR